MKSLNICIDIDGTLTDAYYWLDLANEYFNKSIKESEVTEYHIHKVLGVKKGEYDEFYEKNKVRLHTEEKLRDDAKVVLKVLSTFHNIYFVTARDKSLTVLTHSYLKKRGIPYNDLFVLGSHYKVDKATDLNCSVFIEDSYDNAIQLSNAGFKVLLVDTYYNRNPLNTNIKRVSNWIEIYAEIDDMLLQGEAV